MADGKVTIAVDLDGKKAQADIGSLKSALSGLGSGFKSVLGANLVSGALMSGVSALTGGVKSAFNAAISEGAKLQQSIGGIETLFKGSAGVVKKYAEEAYKTSGLSANEYMENVTSFSASLISSLGGDTEAAASLANRALMDMSDNANKMGTDMGVVTQTYQSLARGNYQMLDNLKLGYGGTKAELKRLLKDTASYKDIQEELNLTVDEGDLSFGNIVKAISVMQKKLDITGTTAKEASITFTGAFSSMRAAFKDFLGNLTTGGDIKKPLENLAKTASTFVFRNAIPMIVNAFSNLPKAITTFMASAGPEIKAGLKAMFPDVDFGFFDKVSNAFSNFKIWVGFFVQDVKNAFSGMFDGFNSTGAFDAILNAFDKFSLLGLDISEKFDGQIPWESIGQSIGNIAKFLADAAAKGAEFIASIPGEDIRAIASGVLAAVAAFKGLQSVSGIIKGVSGSFGLLKAVLTNPFGLAIVGVGLLVAAFVKAYTTSETFRTKVDEVVASVKNFLSNMDPERLKSWAATITAVAGGFAIFKMLNGWNPFKTFGSGGKSALDSVKSALSGTSGQASQSKGIIEQVFSGLGTLITSIAQGISTVLQGLATALSTVAQGFGTAAAMASPAQWLSMGAAMLMVGAGVALASAGIYVLVQAAIQLASAGSGAAIALAGLGVGIAAMAGLFALLGPALTASAVGMVAFGAAVALIGAGIGMAAAGLAMLASQLPTIATYGASAASAILALSGAVIAFGAGVAVAGAGLLVLSAGLIAFGAASLVAAAGGVALAAGIVVVSAAVAAFGLALQPVASAVKKMGQGAKDAGAGTKQLASGLKSITSLPLGSLVTHLGAVAIGIGKISGKGGEIASVGAGMKQLGQGLTTIATFGMLAVTAMTVIGTAITQLSTQMTTLPATLTLAAAGFATFSSQAVAGVAGLSAINVPLTALKTQIMTLAPAFMMASAGLTALGSQAMVVGASFTMLGAGITIVRTGLVGVSTAFILVGTSATSASGQVRAMASSTQVVISAFNAMRGQVQSSMNAMLNVVKSVGNQMRSEGRQTGQQTAQNIAQGIRGGVGQSTSAMQALMNAVRSVGMSGVGSMRYIGSMIGQGLAQGMYAALGAVTAAANALVAQAERAARAKAKIHSPSRLFRDSVGRFLPMGVAVGIEKNTKYVDKSLDSMYDHINAYNFKAEDVIGVGKTKLSKVVQVKQELEQAVKASVEVAKEKSNDLLSKALDVVEKAVQRPAEMVLDDGTLVAKTGDKFASYQSEQIRRTNRMRGIRP